MKKPPTDLILVDHSLTEESDAKSHWCPYSIFPVKITDGTTYYVGANRKTDESNPNRAQCQANDCQAWERIGFKRVDGGKKWYGRCRAMK